MLPGANSHCNQDKANFFGIKDLRIPFQPSKQNSQGGLHDKEGTSQMAKNLAPPGSADEIVMLDDAPMGLQVASRGQADNKALMA
jgi:hypothetical protein